MYYNNNTVLSYNRLFNFTIGPRGAGKTFSFKDRAIRRFKSKKRQFVYIRRYQTEIDEVKEKFWNAMKPHFPNDELEMSGETCLINGEVAGFLLALTRAQTFKSTEFPDVDLIGFDEFIIEDGGQYLKKEVIRFLGLYDTIARLRENVQALFMANAVSAVNPYFLFWGITPNANQRFTKYQDIMIEFYVNQDYVAKRRATAFGRLVEGTAYGEYAINNKFLQDNDNFIEKRPTNSKYQCRIVYNEHNYGIWFDYRIGRLYVSKAYDPYNKLVYTLSTEEHGENTLLLTTATKYPMIKTMIVAFETGNMRFDNIQIKNQMLEIMKKIC